MTPTPFLAMLRAACAETSQASVARRLGVHPHTVGRWLSGEFCASIADRYRAAVVLLGLEGATVPAPASALAARDRLVEGVIAALDARGGELIDSAYVAALLRGEVDV